MGYKEAPKHVMGYTRTLIVTDDCNLRCRYCYEENKKPITMSLEIAKKSVDYFINDAIKNPNENLIWDFIGGEPFVELNLVAETIEYIISKIEEYNLDRKYHYFAFTTNGTMFTPDVKKFLINLRLAGFNVSVGLSLDGIKEIHDYNRSNSFDELMSTFKWWRHWFPYNNTKSTLNSEALPHLFESFKFMVSLGLTDLLINPVYEDVWQDGDVEIWKDQLYKIANYMLDTGLYQTVYTKLFQEMLADSSNTNTNDVWCGCGNKMLAVDHKGNLFPCLRFKTLNKQPEYSCGNIYDGINQVRLLPFKFYHHGHEDCKKCEYRNGCSWCLAYCYDELGTMFNRTRNLCEFHKAQVEVNKYFFSEIERREANDNNMDRSGNNAG